MEAVGQVEVRKVEALIDRKWVECEIVKENPATYWCRIPAIKGALGKPIVVTRKRWQVRFDGVTPLPRLSATVRPG